MGFHGGLGGFEHGGSEPGTEVLGAHIALAVLKGGGKPCNSPIQFTPSWVIKPS